MKNSTTKLLGIFLILCLTIFFLYGLGNTQEATPDHIKFSLGKKLDNGLMFIEGPMNMTESHPYGGKREVTVERIAIGVDYTFNAYIEDQMDNPIDITPSWKTSNSKIISIKPANGNQVIVRGLKEGVADIVIKAGKLQKIMKGIEVLKRDNFKN